MKNEQKEIFEKQKEIKNRLNDLLLDNPVDTVITMASTIVSILAEKYPPNLTPLDLIHINMNYDNPTEEAINDRSMSIAGLEIAFQILTLTLTIANENNPVSFCQNLVDQDDKVSDKVKKDLFSDLDKIYDKAIKNGMSAFGVSTCMIANGAIRGVERNVAWPLLARPLLDSFQIIMNRNN